MCRLLRERGNEPDGAHHPGQGTSSIGDGPHRRPAAAVARGHLSLGCIHSVWCAPDCELVLSRVKYPRRLLKNKDLHQLAAARQQAAEPSARRAAAAAAGCASSLRISHMGTCHFRQTFFVVQVLPHVTRLQSVNAAPPVVRAVRSAAWFGCHLGGCPAAAGDKCAAAVAEPLLSDHNT